jgi:hypothetical protein
MRKSSTPTLFLIIFLVTSCSPQCNQWKLAVIKADCPPAKYARACLPACNTFNGMEAVLMSSNGTTHFYLNALTLLFPVYECDNAHTEIKIVIEEENYCFIVDRLQGGQRLLLPEEAKQLIVDALLEFKCVEISTGRYQTTLIYENFQNVYSCL